MRDEKGQGFIQILWGGIIGLMMVIISIPVIDAFINVAFNLLDSTTTATQVGAIKTVLGLVIFFVVMTFIVLWLRNLGNPTQGDFT